MIGTTISDNEADEHAKINNNNNDFRYSYFIPIWPGNWWTFGTTIVLRCAHVVPQTPLLNWILVQANGPFEKTNFSKKNLLFNYYLTWNGPSTNWLSLTK